MLLLGAENVQAESPDRNGESQIANTPVIVGYIERAWLEGSAFSINAKLDTGAQSSSLNAVDMVEFEHQARPWVRLVVRNEAGHKLIIERPIVRVARIRRASTKISERPVIKLRVCVAGKSAEVDVTLANRKEMNYDLLIGRSFLSSRLLIDSSATFLSTNPCH